MDDDQHFSNLEDDIAYFKDKREVIVFTGICACPRSLQLDAQQFFMPQISWMQEDIQMYSFSSIDDKDLDQFWCASLWPKISGYARRKHSRNSVIVNVLLSEGILDCINNSHLVNGH